MNEVEGHQEDQQGGQERVIVMGEDALSVTKGIEGAKAMVLHVPAPVSHLSQLQGRQTRSRRQHI
ncbi:MAG: hypothetical protein QXP01_06225 [Candidatus Hadarchaeum sp.]